jgi:ribosomal protein S18 acetylase RimI-like enzyme
VKAEQAFEITKTMHSLDNPIWHALSTLHARFAEGDNLAKRYPIAVTSLAAMSEPTEEAFESLAKALQSESAGLFLDQPPAIPADWKTIHSCPLVQMVFEKHEIARGDDSTEKLAEELIPADTPEMVALAKLTKPGPFGARTRELGEYLGIREGIRLAAMAGERLHLPGYTEVSAVCTHPDFQGRGYARALITILLGKIVQRGETPFLHVREENISAIRLYEKMGFHTRRLIHYVVLQRA